MKTKFIFFLLIFACSANLFSQTSNWLWANRAGEALSPWNKEYSVCSDSSENVIITGIYNWPSITFGSYILPSADDSGMFSGDIFIAKYDPAGNVLWAKRAGGNGFDIGLSVCADAAGNVFLTGSFGSPSITFGAFTLTNANGGNIFIVKYDPNGNVLWAKNTSGGNGNVEVHSIAVDPTDNVFITGNFASSTLTFGSTTITNSHNTGFTNDAFIAKFDGDGNVLWAKNSNGGSDAWGNSGSADANGNVYMTGYFQGSILQFGSTTLSSSAFAAIFLVKYDPNGNVLWSISPAAPDFNESNSVNVDVFGNVFIAGSFESPSINFGASTLVNTDPTGNSRESFLAKYDRNGNNIWARSQTGSGEDKCYSISSDQDGNVYISGNFVLNPISFGPTNISAPSGSYDPMFIGKYDTNGNLLCATALANAEYNMNGISAGPFGNAYVVGTYSVNPFNVGSYILPLAGNENVFVAKYVCQCTPIISISGDLSVCQGDSTTLTAIGAATYFWLPDSSYSDSIRVAPGSTTNYSVIGTSLTGCSDTATVSVSTMTPPVVLLDLSPIDTQCIVVSSVMLSGGFPSGGIYSGTGVNANYFFPSSVGFGGYEISYFYTDMNGCSTSSIDSIFVSPCPSGIRDYKNNEGSISISPNPFSTSTIIQFNSQLKNGVVELYNLYGQKIKSIRNISTDKIELTREELPDGIYFIRVTEENKLIATEKIIIAE